MLNNNYLRALPYELGKLFQLATLGLKVRLSNFRSRKIYTISFRATHLGLMCCSCSRKWMAQESSWTSCSTILQCPPAIHSPGKHSNWIFFWIFGDLCIHQQKLQSNEFWCIMSIVQALDPASALGQGQPHCSFHSHVLQCSLRQVAPVSLLFLYVFADKQTNKLSFCWWVLKFMCSGMQRAAFMATAHSGL